MKKTKQHTKHKYSAAKRILASDFGGTSKQELIEKFTNGIASLPETFEKSSFNFTGIVIISTSRIDIDSPLEPLVD